MFSSNGLYWTSSKSKVLARKNKGGQQAAGEDREPDNGILFLRNIIEENKVKEANRSKWGRQEKDQNVLITYKQCD